MSTSPKKGYLVVFSRPTHPSFSTSHNTFNKWYNEVHIPDILRLGRPDGFTSAFRYTRAGFNPSDPSSTADKDFEVTYPKNEKWLYLAMYPVPDVVKASRPDSGLYKAPLVHEMLPGGGNAMEVAKWELGFWEVVGEKERKNNKLTTTTDSSKDTDVILVPVDSSDIPGYDIPGAHPSALLDYSRKGWEGSDPVRSRLLKYTAPAYDCDGTGIKQYLAVHEVEPNTEQTLKPEFKTVKYKLYKKFGV
ncbi:hypothetical protein NEUTE1DRAFT_88388 [Neurospora tetrasperma FGSC 2508]|uniref:EthD domain-containing protein n=1 Tax=Neurospora tetrasperma (strain FGSC 2508 / ATCC MYA-4615 / P0657) TaxID=510951 RepID=F8MVM8_NEUT8|nr:uncharacterized protein NEUTE1DRAFT_88388 [Neurospora tetrasperma FGSC 2508]EGO54779.1 hypothetical protein NEUTE1DRAFT_88388 [Neurospora tetrasperma FGSC 2508]EGZ67738.1 hypothetical protein NEUTE2DRAFT_116949 [Neurospora tetrasperma FGSC 2509]